MENIIWFIKTDKIVFHLRFLLVVLLPIFIINYSNHFIALIRNLILKVMGLEKRPMLRIENRLEAMVAIPTLLKTEDELEGLKKAILSLSQNEYPGKLYIFPAIDGRAHYPALYKNLEDWCTTVSLPESIKIFVTGNDDREGKAVAIDSTIEKMKELHHSREVARLPKIFFCLDADSLIAPDAIRRMVYKLTSKSRFTGKRPMIVAGNVKIMREQYWEGWKKLFTERGFLALSIATEYMTKISVTKHNFSLKPVTVASGAFYCTWFKILEESARYAGFIHSLEIKDCLRWWLGAPPPKFSQSNPEPLPHALAGEGDDTWITFLAYFARWHRGRITFDFERTPLHALRTLVMKYLFRPLVYDPKAIVYTKTPTTALVLFKQRMRWNNSCYTLKRWLNVNMYLGNFEIFLCLVYNISRFFLVMPMPFLLPYLYHHSLALSVVLFLYLVGVLNSTATVLLAMFFERDFKAQWHKLLLIPLQNFYGYFFNIVPGFISNFQDLFLFGTNRRFAPEKTLIRGKTSRIALGFRFRRFVILSVRTLLGEPIPFGWFWLGWHATPWTSNGYEGWDQQKRPTFWGEFFKNSTLKVNEANEKMR